MINSDALTPLILSAFTKEITWLEASSRYSLDEFVDSFFQSRERTQENLESLTDAQVAFSSPAHSFWSISESVTHLIYTQGFYHNKLLDISTSQLPHLVEAARGFGEGAKQNVPVKDLRVSLNAATERIQVVIDQTRNLQDPEKTEVNSAFGICNYKTWILLMLAHELDHLRQMAAMRRLARTSL
ncbi:MAG: DinB family protein [Anaerolineales bacterium]|nr:DinB family protein [Anaerolineales bacterium]